MFPYLIAGAIGYAVAKIFESDEAPKYADGGSVLLAPNGKPSNLTPEQYKLVRLPEFKAWFGDWENDTENASKVVDSNGEPMVLYHGTDVNFNVYDLSKIGEGSDLLGKGIYLTENKDVANFYANLVAKKRYIKGYEDGFFGSTNAIYEEDADEKAEKHKLIYEFFVNAKNIKNINQININNDLKQILIKSISFIFKDKSEDVINSRIDFADKNHNQIRNYRGKIIYLIEQFPDAKKEILEYIKNKYDCIFFEPTTEFESNLKDYKNYVIFKPNQIKLANGTNTTFDGNNPDIRYADGGQVNFNELIEGYEFLLEIETDEQKIKTYRDLIAGYELALELEEEEIEEVEQIQEEMNEEVAQDDFTPSYLMTLDDYKAQVTPLIQEYKKFLRKNKDWFVKPDYSGIAHYSLEEALELKDSPNEVFSRIGLSNDMSKEQIVRYNYSYMKNRSFNEEYTQEPTPKNLISQNKEYIKKLQKYFTINDINSNIEDDETKSNKRAVRRAIDKGIYKDLLSNNKVEFSELEKVADSVGVRLPKSIFNNSKQNQMKYESELGKLLSHIPPLSFKKLQELIEQIKVDLIPLEKEVYDKEYARYSKLMQGFIGVTKKADDFTISLPIWQDLLISQSEYREEPTSRTDWKGNIRMESVKYVTVNGLKNDWESKLSAFVKEKVDILKYSILLAIMKNFANINMPIASIERLRIEVGYLGFDGSYRFNFENGSSFVMNFQGIGAGGYNIQTYHFRFLTNFSDVKLADGSIGGTNYYNIADNFSIKN